MKTKKRLLSILLTLALMLGLLPGMSLTAYADSWTGNPYASLVNTTNTVKFNGMAWYVIEDNSTAVNAGTLTLLARDPLCASVFNNGDRYTDNIDQYSSSVVRTLLDNLTTGTGSFVNVVDAIVPVDLQDVSVTGAKLWLLSLDQAQTIYNTNKFILICPAAPGVTNNLNYCWTRTKVTGTADDADHKIHTNHVGYYAGDNGKVKSTGMYVYRSANVRPALKLDLSKISLSNVTVTLSGGANATTTGGGRIQRFFGSDTTIETVYYHGGTCGTFPATSEYYTTTDGITVEYIDSKTLKVSGTPTKDDVNITIPDAAASHNFGYTASGATITAGCKTSGCPARSSFDPVKLTIAAPDDDGSSTEATLTNLDAFNSATNQSISTSNIKYYNATKNSNVYTKGDEITTGAPTGAGDYMAEITVSGVTASIGYTLVHTHSFTYAAGTGDKANTITATCSADGCDLPEVESKHVATLTIAAPTTGNDATITVSPEGALTGYTVRYQTKTGGTWGAETETAPSTAGIHKATVTLGGTTASVTYGSNCITYATNLEHGSINGDTGATCGATITPTITPDEGYELDALTVTPEAGSGVSADDIAVDGDTFVMPEANVTVSATFKKINRAITLTQPASGGTLTAKKGDAAVTTADYGDTITLGNTPADGYEISSYSVTKTGESTTVVTVTDGTFSMPAYPVTVTGTFTPIDYTVTVNSGANGSVTAKKGTSDVTTANIGDEITLTYNPNAGYQLDIVTVTKEGGGTVTVTNDKFTMPASNVTVSATFKEITYTVEVDAANGAKATVKDDMPEQHTYTAELNIPADKTYDGETVDLTTAFVQKSAGFPAKVTVGAVSFKDENDNTVTTAKNVGTYTASATVGEKTISKVYTIHGRTPSITYVESTEKIGNNIVISLVTTDQYLPLESKPNGIVLLKDGETYVASGNIEIGALVFVGDVKLILCKNTTVTIYAGIYHIGSTLNIYTEEGADDSEVIVKGNKTLSNLTNDTGRDVSEMQDAGSSLSGTIYVHGVKLIVEQGNSNLVSDDISLTLGAGIRAKELTGGTEHSDGSVTYGKEAFANHTSLAVKPVAIVTTEPTANTTLTYTGQAQALVTVGAATGGEMKYAVTAVNQAPDSAAYTFDNTTLPTATDAGTYYVWYMVKGDENHLDYVAETPVTVIIAPGHRPEIVGHSLVLTGSIGVRFYVALPGEEWMNYSTCRMTFKLPGEEKSRTMSLSDAEKVSITQNGETITCAVFTCYVNAVQMADEITARLEYTAMLNGTPRPETEPITETYSARQYIRAFRDAENRYDAKTLKLVKALAEYGYYAQLYLSDVRGWSLGSDHVAMDDYGYTPASYTDADREAAKTALAKYAISVKRSSKIEKVSFSLSLDSDTALHLYFTPAASYKGGAAATVDGAATEVTKKDGRFALEIPGISAHRLGNTFNVKLVTGGQTTTVKVSALSYVYAILNNAKDSLAANAMIALYKYYQAAAAYKA